MRTAPAARAAILALILTVPVLGAQGIKDRLKKVGITVSSGKKDSSKAPGAAAKAEAAKPLPTSSVAHPDVAGFTIGTTTVAEAKGVIGKATPVLMIGPDNVAILSGHSEAGRTDVDVPNSKHVRTISALSKAYATTYNLPAQLDVQHSIGCTTVTDAKGNCERIDVYFASPPYAPVIVGLKRQAKPAPQPLFDVVEKSLISKYGEPSVRFSNHPDYMTYQWIWSADGKLMPKHDIGDRVCGGEYGSAANVFNQSGIRRWAGEQSESVLGGGCAALLEIQVDAPNKVVREMTYSAVDVFSLYTSNIKSVALQDSVVTAYEKKQREDAAKVKPPE